MPSNAPPTRNDAPADDWTPFRDRLEFEFADFAFRRNQMSAGDIDVLLDLWAASLFRHGDCPPYADHVDMNETIDSIPHGDVRWQSFTTTYNGERPQNGEDVPSWMDAEYDVWFRDPHTLVCNLLSNPDFDGEFDYVPYKEFEPNGDRRFQNFFSGDWVWSQAVHEHFISTQ